MGKLGIFIHPSIFLLFKNIESLICNMNKHFASRWLHCNYLFLMSAYCLIFFSLSVLCVLFSSPLFPTILWRACMPALTPTGRTPQPPGDRVVSLLIGRQAWDWEPDCNAHCFLQMSASWGLAAWWLKNAVCTHWQLTIPDRTVRFSLHAVCWEYVQSFLGPGPSTLLFPLLFQPFRNQQYL